MTVETATYISQLNSAYPTAGDARSEGDDHLRLLKAVLQAQFSGLGAAPVTVTATELNSVTSKANTTALGLTLITVASASNSAAIDFTSGITSTYEEYELHIINAVPSSAAVVPWLRTSSDAGASWASTSGDYNWTMLTARGTTATVTNGSTTASRIELSRQTINTTAADGGFSGVIRFVDPANGAPHRKQIYWTGTAGIDGSTPGNNEVITGQGARMDASNAINGVRFLFSSGNISTGKFKLYGVRKS